MGLCRLAVPLLVAMIAVLSGAARAHAQPFHLEDTLRGGTSGNPIGGSFGADGWTVTAVDDRIWYALPRLASGSIELTVSNITLANLPLADHEIFAMYEAGHGMVEPLRYSPEFRQNHYKMLIRVYGTPEPDRAGYLKMMWGMCPSGAPGYNTADAPCGCGSFFEEPFANPGAWTGAPVRLRVEWGGGHSRLLRDGVEVVGVDWSASGIAFGPHDLHMMIGSPRNDGGLAAMPIGAVFSDLVIDGELGPISTCPGETTPDAGVPTDAGMERCTEENRLAAIALTPDDGRGERAMLRATYQHCDGADAFRAVEILVGDDVASPDVVRATYEDGQLALGTERCTPGEARTLRTTLGALDCASTTVSRSVDDLTIDWAFDLDATTFAGTHDVFFDAYGPGRLMPEVRLGWTRMGTFTVERAVAGADGGRASIDAASSAGPDAGRR
nr:hypothetical protein [Myxococcota bacterium]